MIYQTASQHAAAMMALGIDDNNRKLLGIITMANLIAAYAKMTDGRPVSPAHAIIVAAAKFEIEARAVSGLSDYDWAARA
jgi:hypothetical protein